MKYVNKNDDGFGTKMIMKDESERVQTQLDLRSGTFIDHRLAVRCIAVENALVLT